MDSKKTILLSSLIAILFIAFIVFNQKDDFLIGPTNVASQKHPDESVSDHDEGPTRVPAAVSDAASGDRSAGSGGADDSNVDRGRSGASAKATSPWTPSKELLASLPSKEEVAKRLRERRETIQKYKSRAAVSDNGATVHWLDGLVGVYEERVKDPRTVLFEDNGVAYVRAEDAPENAFNNYQAVYDPSLDRVGVLTGIVVIARDHSFDPVGAAQSVGIRHSSSRLETGLHFFDPPKRSASETMSILEELRQKPGVQKVLLGTVYERARPQ